MTHGNSIELVGILRGLTPEAAPATGAALVAAGFRTMEVPLNSPQPFDTIRLLAAAHRDCLVGAGTVLTPAEVDRVHDAGGRLVVAPNCDPAVIRRALEKGLRVLPGIGTATEAFAAVHLVILADSADELVLVAGALHGTLTAAIYSDVAGSDDALERRLAPLLRTRAGRLLNDKMPTGVAVSSAMNHGGPFPATGHPGFTSVGLPASIARFTALHCYDQVRPARLPRELRDENPDKLWRDIDGEWSRGDVSAAPSR